MVEYDSTTRLTAEELIAAYRGTTGTVGDAIADCLLAEIEHRRLDLWWQM